MHVEGVHATMVAALALEERKSGHLQIVRLTRWGMLATHGQKLPVVCFVRTYLLPVRLCRCLKQTEIKDKYTTDRPRPTRIVRQIHKQARQTYRQADSDQTDMYTDTDRDATDSHSQPDNQTSF
jgi:hypothetical protein